MSPKLYVTTTHKTSQASVDLAQECSEILGVPFLERQRRSFEQISQDEDAGFLVISKKLEMVLVYGEEEFFFHPSMSKVRIKALRHGSNDPMLTAMAAEAGDRILDCTLGLGSDAIVVSYAVGEVGKVVGLESEPALAMIVQHGLKNYNDSSYRVNEAMRRIEVIREHHLHYLSCLPDNSFDIVYFDPMFRKPLHRSSSMEPMRGWVNREPLTGEALAEATRVAAKRVVIKESSSSEEFARLGFKEVVGGKYSPIAYGVMNVCG